ncbi:imidazole glycerol phosphate synthase subunit HisH, partial [bacterium]
MTTILDYGMGNLRSVEKAIEALGAPVRIAEEVGDAERVILPGVGAFGAAMARLAPMRDELRAFAASGRPLLGICLGQQLLFERSEEFGDHEGLGLLKGDVRYLPAGEGRKIPLMGWSAVTVEDEVLGRGVRSNDQFYFVHSLY